MTDSYRPEPDPCKPRPTTMRHHDDLADAGADGVGLAFRPRPPVHWFSPAVLARSGAQVVLSATFGDYLDKRELQGAIDCEIHDSLADLDECWVDVICDTGDGFDATYTVAWCAAQRELRPDNPDGTAGPTLPRGALVVFGGDEVYPIASTEDYEDRFVGPHTAALPCLPEDERPTLLAIPGNHDWYDGLTSFMRIFGQGRTFGGRCTEQTRSYFAVELPHGHWIWGIDVQDGSYLDVAQIDYFREAAKRMAGGDRLILFTAEPTWADTETDAYDNIAWVERTLVPDFVETVMMISGDLHHYAHYRSAGGGRAKLTAGGGGAFLYPTTKLPDSVQVPPAGRRDEPPETFALGGSGLYPTKERSRRMSWRVLGLGMRNPRFLLVPAVVHLLLFLANTAALADPDRPFDAAAPGWSVLDLATGTFRSPFTNILAVFMVLLLGLFFDMPKNAGRLPTAAVRTGVGVAHTAVWLLLNGVIAFVGIGLLGHVGDPWTRPAIAAFVLVAGGVVGSVAMGLYLLLAFLLAKRHSNEVFSAFRAEEYKNFLRLHVTADGVTVYPIGIDRSHHDWDVDPDNPAADASHIRPVGEPITARLIEEPFTVSGDRASS